MAKTSAVRGLLLLGLVLAGSALVAARAAADVAAPARIAASAAPAAVEMRVVPEPRGGAVVVAGTPAPTEAPVAATEPPADPTEAPPPPPARPIVASVAAAAPEACPLSFFCYPRLGIAGPIVEYDDCSGLTDVGLEIRQLICVRDGIWLAGHAYTQFGRLTGFRVGDTVIVRGQRFAITGSSIQRSCEPTTHAVAPLSLQTSLESASCGQVLVVEGR